ncbi:Hsp20/alpha crystallin family protein [Pelagicoccus albus]|uniref:Hsp20/alpha crystallin family protein n=1 Tax=Pelagicoccus albus TaxID=415222 RepID=A0A7X1B3C7_9BACT|nr:Hsp20/alpha crystallin family protein [Pelagicoccus albus]MBC2604757.1 Hsp20/alpha crystallin family protein [Pelagicoccus albus]
MNKELAKTEQNDRQEEAPVYRKPKYVVHSEENAYRLEVHLPGVSKDGARITLDGNILTIEADPSAAHSQDWQTFRRERPEGSFRLNLELNVDIDGDGIKAEVQDGVLSMLLPLAAKAAKRAIEIQ